MLAFLIGLESCFLGEQCKIDGVIVNASTKCRVNATGRAFLGRHFAPFFCERKVHFAHDLFFFQSEGVHDYYHIF